jgi:DNA-binding transcriptional regulator of glucitol operon
MKQIKDLAAQMPSSARDRLSSSAQHLLRIAARWDDLQNTLAQSAASQNRLNGHGFSPQSGTLPIGEVNDPGTDLVLSRMAGFVQSETSTAWCGQNVLVAYNDSGSFLETFPLPIGLSFNGYSLSTDGGKTFTDEGYLNAGPSLSNFLVGDPVAVCTDENTFYQSSIFETVTTGASVSKSTDGGRTFADPVQAVSKDPSFHFIDKPWMAADPSNPKKLYVTYTDVDFEGFDPAMFPTPLCPGDLRLGIELVSSTDGGATWSAPTIVDIGCFQNSDQGSNVAVDGKGNVFVAWEQFPATLPVNEIDIAKSTNGGASFAPKAVVSIVQAVGDVFGVFTLGLIQGGFRNNEFPSLAIDLSQGGSGPLYVAWNDGRFNRLPDAFPPGLDATYQFGDVVASRSSDGGISWSSPVKVNGNKNAASPSAPVDHYLPGIAVDHTGTVGVCWYDRRRDATNFNIDRECAHSRDGGLTWKNHRITKATFSPIIAEDQLINPTYMGDYDTTAADTLGASNGFLGAYGDNSRGNPDVSISRRFGTPNDNNNDD